MPKVKRCTASEAEQAQSELEHKYTDVKCHDYKELANSFPMEDEPEEEEDDLFALYDNVTEDEEGNIQIADGEDDDGNEEEGDADEGADGPKTEKKKRKSKLRLPKLVSKAKKEREEILQEAKRLGDSRTEEDKRHIIVIYNPVSGAGAAKRLVRHMVEPVLKLCKVKYSVVETQYRRFAVEYMEKLDPSTADGIIIAGGDGLVHEVITGYFLNPNEKMREVPVGITPSGTANAMAHELHRHPSITQVSIVGRAAIAVAKGHTRRVDVLEVNGEKEKIYALSVFGWGLAGAVALKADQLRWIPGQKKARYDIAGAVTVLSDWPVIDACKFEYLKEHKNPITKKVHSSWKTEMIDTINMVATNMPYLGNDHPIYEYIGPDDGNVACVFVKGSCSRLDVIRLARDMKRGIHLAKDTKRCKSFITKEFKITPTKAKSPFNIDGDPHDHGPVHVRVLNRALSMYTLPERGDTLAEHVAHSGMPLPMALAGVSVQELNSKGGRKSAPDSEKKGVSALATAMFETNHGK